MRSSFSFIVFISVFLFSFFNHTSFAAESHIINGVNVDPLVKEFQAAIFENKRSFHVYHWFEASEETAWASNSKASDPRAFQLLKNDAGLYWGHYAEPSDDMYGLGLYLAVDPIATQNYGGENWVLLRVEFPVGFRILEASNPAMTNSLNSELLNLLTTLDCPKPQNLDQLIQSGNSPLEISSTCQKNVTQILRDVLKIDAFSYRYFKAFFSNCQNVEHEVAFVLTSASQLKPNHVKIFNSNTTDEKTERQRIQSLFYRSASDASISKEIFLMSGYSPVYTTTYIRQNYPSSKLFSMSGILYVCPLATKDIDESCKQISKPFPQPFAYPGIISKENIPFSIFSNIGGLLWKDLDGEKTDSNINEWIKNTLFSCSPGQF